jgi:hypothetical protein
VTPQRYVVDATRSDTRWAVLAAGFALSQEIFRTRRDLYHVVVLHDQGWGWWSIIEAGMTLLVALAFFVTLVRMLDRRESVVLDVRGVLVRDHSDEIIPWGAIKRIWPEGKNRVCFTLHDPGRYPAQGLWRWLALRKPKGADVDIAVPGKEERRDELIDAFNAWRPALIRGL